jgi:hypothetical protein
MKWSIASWAMAGLAALPHASAITPEGMIASNRYSAAVPNPSGVCIRDAMLWEA